MTNHKQLFQKTLLAGALVSVAAMGLTGCGGEEAPPPVAQNTAPPPPPPPPKPAVTPVADLMAQLGIDERVILPEDQAPQNDNARIALLNFFDAMVRGDDQTVSEMIPLTDREQLDALVESGQWKKTTGDAIDMVELRTGKDPLGGDVVLALYTVGLDYEPQMWTYGSSGGEYVFEAVPGPPDILDRITGTDLIAEWFKYLNTELALADEPDVVLKPVKSVMGGDGGSSSSAKSGGGQPSGPVGGPGPGKQRRPIPKRPIKPPGPGGSLNGNFPQP